MRTCVMCHKTEISGLETVIQATLDYILQAEPHKPRQPTKQTNKKWLNLLVSGDLRYLKKVFVLP